MHGTNMKKTKTSSNTITVYWKTLHVSPLKGHHQVSSKNIKIFKGGHFIFVCLSRKPNSGPSGSKHVAY